MKDSNFTIKVHDFLSKKTLSDVVIFSNKFSTSLPQVSDGLHCEVHIQAGDDKSFFVTIKELQYTTKNTCDICSTTVEKEITQGEVFIKFFADCDEDLLKENEYSFTSGEGYIDIENILVQEIILFQDISSMCSSCSKHLEQKNDDTNGGNSIIRK